MNLENLKKQLIIDEGCSYEVYLDSKGYPTFGIGHLLTKFDIEWHAYKNLKKGGKLTVSKERVDEVFKKDIEIVCADCKAIFPYFDKMPEEIKQIVANMVFNLGRFRFKGFNALIKAINEKNYKMAAKEMMYKDGQNPAKGFSDWYVDTKGRAKRLVARMEKFADDDLCKVKN